MSRDKGEKVLHESSDEPNAHPRRIALLIEGEGNYRQLASQLDQGYELVEHGEDEMPRQEFDLAIIDGPGLKRWHSRLDELRENEQPVFLPVMMILPRPDLRRIAGAHSSLVDDFILTPIDRREFIERVDILLRARGQSIRQREHLTYTVNHDRASGLPTQALFLDRLHSYIDRANPGESIHVIATHIPLAQFMRSLGQAAVSEIARQGAAALKAALPDDIYMARLATEQGAILPPPGTSVEEVTHLCSQIARALQTPLDIDGEKVRLSAFIGVSCYPDDSRDAESTLNAALSALEGASKPGQPKFYSGEVQNRALRFLRIEDGLHRALSEGELELWYQPQFRLSDLELVGAEALIRWRLPSGEMMPPGEFIPVAESSDLIQQIGAWVLETACRTLGEWCANELPCPRVSVNVTPEDLMTPDFLPWLNELLAANKLAPDALEIELTETMLLKVDETVLGRLNEIRDLGVKVAIDDFGTGYSSLGYLHALPADVLKIDKTFTDRVPGDQAGEAITGAIVGLARQFGLEVVAEGIETRSQLDYLDSLGVENGQGFLIARPMPETEFLEFVTGGLRLPEE